MDNQCEELEKIVRNTDKENGTNKIDKNNGNQKLNFSDSAVLIEKDAIQPVPLKITLTQPPDESENISEFTYEATETSIENDLLLENTQLKERFAKINEQYGNLQTLLHQKDDVIELQKKELSVVAAEKDALRREFETGKKEKEHAVVRYAMLEKNIIDANSAKDLSAKKLRDAQKEVEALTNRVKFVSNERDKAHKEIRDYLRESEQLKYDLQTLETKLKWSQRSLTQEKANKMELEKKLNDLTEQLNQLTEQRQHQINTDKKSEQEQGAQVIMLKHMVDEKERNLNQSQKSLTDLRTEFTLLFEKNETMSKDFDLERQKCAKLEADLERTQNQFDERNKQYEELQAALDECENSLKMQKEENDLLGSTINKLKYIEESYREQSEEMAVLRSKEDEYMSLLKDLTEKCVLVENKLILANSKSSALMLDNERLNKDHKLKVKMVKELDDDLVKTKLKHSDEIKLFNRILADEKSHSETLQNKLDNIVGDLEATKNKHCQVVKELNRELVTLRKRSNESSPSADSGFGTDVENRSTQQSQSQSNGSNSHLDNQEPSKKALIDRIVKLQRQLAKQTEKIEFLENHCVALFNELKAKTS